MVFNFNKKKEFNPNNFSNNPFYNDSIGVWGVVEEVNSKLNQVNVTTNRGLKFIGIPVISNEWVLTKDDYVPSSRNLPPVGATVFVLMPNKTVSGAFVLCSGFLARETTEQVLFAKNDSELEEKNNTRERITQGGWDITEEYETGIVKFKSKDENITLLIDSENEITLTAYDNVITITKDEVKLEPKKLTVESENDIKLKCANSIIYTDKLSVKKSATSPIAALEVTP